MHRAVLLAVGAEIEEVAIRLPDGQPMSPRPTRSARAAQAASLAAEAATRGFVGQTVAAVEQQLIIDTLEHCLGNRTHAANILGISIRTLRNKLKEYTEAGVAVPAPQSGHAASAPPDRSRREIAADACRRCPSPLAAETAQRRATCWGWVARGEVALALGVVGIVVLLILPIPAFLLDLLLAISITSAVLILMTSLLIKKPLEFTAFPTVLLVTTLFRLGAEHRLDAADPRPRPRGRRTAPATSSRPSAS